MSNAKVELFDVALKRCAGTGLCIPTSTSEILLVATRCEFANNGIKNRRHSNKIKVQICILHVGGSINNSKQPN